MDPTERAQLAAVEHYDHRARQLAGILQAAPFMRPSLPYAGLDSGRALQIIARARRAELLDPDPLPHIERSADA